MTQNNEQVYGQNLVLWAATVRNRSFDERVKAAKAGGFKEMSVFPIDIKNWATHGNTIEDLLQMMDEAGLRITILDPLTSWVPEWQIPQSMTEEDAAFINFTPDEFFKMAKALNVDKVSLIEPFGKKYDPKELQEAFNNIVDVANEYGMKAQVEFMPFSAISSLEEAWSLVEKSGKVNAGLVFDTWHYYRGKINDSLLKNIPGEKIFSIQLADAIDEVHPNGILFDLLHFRKAPLDGDFTMIEMRDILKDIRGLSSIGIELFSDNFDSLTSVDVGSKARASINSWITIEKETESKILRKKIWELCSATLSQDSAMYEHLLDREFIGISFHGKRVGKDIFSNIHLNPDNAFSLFSTSQVQVKIVDENVSVVDGILTIQHTDSDDIQTNRFTSILQKEAGEWKFIHWQDSPISKT